MLCVCVCETGNINMIKNKYYGLKTIVKLVKDTDKKLQPKVET